eukprot:m.144149 g.144149  ORF g.144149 m.144149 type:complete len:423 (+) comp9669_c0_seq2:334-1602(+)
MRPGGSGRPGLRVVALVIARPRNALHVLLPRLGPRVPGVRGGGSSPGRTNARTVGAQLGLHWCHNSLAAGPQALPGRPAHGLQHLVALVIGPNPILGRLLDARVDGQLDPARRHRVSGPLGLAKELPPLCCAIAIAEGAFMLLKLVAILLRQRQNKSLALCNEVALVELGLSHMPRKCYRRVELALAEQTRIERLVDVPSPGSNLKHIAPGRNNQPQRLLQQLRWRLRVAQGLDVGLGQVDAAGRGDPGGSGLDHGRRGHGRRLAPDGGKALRADLADLGGLVLGLLHLLLPLLEVLCRLLGLHSLLHLGLFLDGDHNEAADLRVVAVAHVVDCIMPHLRGRVVLVTGCRIDVEPGQRVQDVAAQRVLGGRGRLLDGSQSWSRGDCVNRHGGGDRGGRGVVDLAAAAVARERHHHALAVDGE